MNSQVLSCPQLESLHSRSTVRETFPLLKAEQGLTLGIKKKKTEQQEACTIFVLYWNIFTFCSRTKLCQTLLLYYLYALPQQEQLFTFRPCMILLKLAYVPLKDSSNWKWKLPNMLFFFFFWKSRLKRNVTLAVHKAITKSNSSRSRSYGTARTCSDFPFTWKRQCSGFLKARQIYQHEKPGLWPLDKQESRGQEIYIGQNRIYSAGMLQTDHYQKTIQIRLTWRWCCCVNWCFSLHT